MGNDLCQRRLPHPGWSPQDERGDTSGVNHLAQNGSGAYQMFLPYIFVQGLWTHTLCQWLHVSVGFNVLGMLFNPYSNAIQTSLSRTSLERQLHCQADTVLMDTGMVQVIHTTHIIHLQQTEYVMYSYHQLHIGLSVLHDEA